MLIANIEPVQAPKGVGTKLSTAIVYYDMQAQHVIVDYFILNEAGSYVDHQKLEITDQNILSNWGTDDTIIAQAVADFQGYTIISFE
tara:strand:+ start:294 stop:554 length:261 start_codon:yes stop_codon:yes gene_type:complete